MKQLIDFLVFCSGANLEILRRSEFARDRERFATIGATILLTAATSLLSAAYALTFVFASLPMAIVGGIVWALLIFSLDRLLTSSLPKRYAPAESSLAERIRAGRRTLISALPRLLLAAIVGAVLAVPIQLRVLNGTIDREHNAELARIAAAIRAQFPDISRLESDTAKMKTELRTAEAREMMLRDAMINEPSQTLSGPIFEERRKAFIAARVQATELRARLQPMIVRNERQLSALQTKAERMTEGLSYSPDSATRGGLVSRIATLQDLSERNPEIRRFTWALNALFILFQITPLLAHMLSRAGPYDEFWEKFEALARLHPKVDTEIAAPTGLTPAASEAPDPITIKTDAGNAYDERRDRVRAFICHSSDDKTAVRALCERLKRDGIVPWLDEEQILPGQDWDLEIRKAIKSCDVVIVCLSETSVRKTGYAQKEIRFAIDCAAEQPEGSVFVIPAKLEQCDTPARLQTWQYVKLFEPNGYALLLRTLNIRRA